MRILFSIHLFYPQHAAGGESYIKNIALDLISRGHQCRVLLLEADYYGITDPYIYENIEVFPPTRNLDVHFTWSDIVLTHLGHTNWTIQICSIYQKPVYFVSHNTHFYDIIAASPFKQIGVIYNSFAMRDILKYERPSCVLHPPVDFRKYDNGKDPEQNSYITLISLNKNKGGEIFYNIAKELPGKRFLGVKGSYDEQIIKDMPNVEIVENTADIGAIYAKTRLVLMPSEYESWGMVATEAMCNGIPVIYNPTFGLDENVGDAGVKVNRKDIKKWVREISKFDDPVYYQKMSEKARARSRELDPLKELEEFEKFINDTDKFY